MNTALETAIRIAEKNMPVEIQYIICSIETDKNKPHYYTGRGWDTDRNKALTYEYSEVWKVAKECARNLSTDYLVGVFRLASRRKYGG